MQKTARIPCDEIVQEGQLTAHTSRSTNVRVKVKYGTPTASRAKEMMTPRNAGASAERW